MNDATIALAWDIVKVAQRVLRYRCRKGGDRGERADAAAVVRSVPAGCCRRRARTLPKGGPARVTATVMQTPP